LPNSEGPGLARRQTQRFKTVALQKRVKMDIGTIKNLLVWVEKEHPKPVRINDTLLDTDQTRELVSYLKKAIALADGLKGRMDVEEGYGLEIIRNKPSK
jgi:hypothetical protein